MTDILFVQNYFERMIGIMQISAVLKQNGFRTAAAVDDRDAVLDHIRSRRPLVVGFYCTTGFHHRALALAADVKRRFGNDVLTVLGGPHPTFVPSVIESEGVDIICRGEGESALLELLQALKAGGDYSGIRNLWVKRDGSIQRNDLRPPCDLDALPFPDREIYRSLGFIYKLKRQEIMLGRGCPFRCSFCANQAYDRLYEGNGRHRRLRAVENVIEELVALRQAYRPSCFFFHDDSFTAHKEYCADLLEAYPRRVATPFACLVRADQVSRPLVQQLRDAGCYSVYFGVESGDSRLRRELLGKEIGDDTLLECARLLQDSGIRYSTFNMVGLPGERLCDVWKTVKMNQQIRPAWAWFSVYQTLPGTALAEQALAQGRVDAIDVAVEDATFHAGSMILRAHAEGRKILRLKNLANVLVKLPVLAAAVGKRVLNLPLDSVLAWLDRMLYFVFYYSKLEFGTGPFAKLSSGLFLLRHFDASGKRGRPALIRRKPG
jgi:radical SAM superfamily enzyme YgiQ (UPF0313 family)